MMRRQGRLLAAAVAATMLATAPAAQAGDHFTKEPTATGTGGAAATVDALATKAAIRELRRGGNAIDAAVSAAGVLGVTEPFSSGIGGGGFMVIRTRDGRITTIDGRETAPAGMRPDSFFDENGKALPFDKAYDTARWSGLSVGVPGTVATWDQALRRYGTISLRQALRPGARVARRGFPVDQTFYNQVDAVKDWFDDIPSTARIYLDPDGTPRDVGTTLRNPDMASAYRYIGRHGAEDGFYRGPIAAAIAKAANDPPYDSATANHRWRDGVMTTRDIARYHAIWRQPTHVNYRGLDVWSMGPPSSGGSTVGEALNILEGFPATRDPVETLHRFIEASRYAFADRNAYLADPAYYNVPLKTLLSDEYAAKRRANIGEQAANAVVAPGGADEQKGTSTTHLTVTDRQGNVVSYTFTIESTGGAGIVVPGWGFLLNNELTDFNFDSLTHPNRVEPGKRPRSSISPTIVTRNGKPVIALGSPGGATIITTVLQLLVERFDLGKTLPEAIAAPRVSQRNAVQSEAEPAFIASPEAAALRSQHGHAEFKPVAGDEIGAATGIDFLPGGRLQAAAEPVRRGGGSAAVVNPR
jgi:gamma-glutamyltranspeptidase / glutathione hydrolase